MPSLAGLGSAWGRHPGPASWANICRRSAAGVEPGPTSSSPGIGKYITQLSRWKRYRPLRSRAMASATFRKARAACDRFASLR